LVDEIIMGRLFDEDPEVQSFVLNLENLLTLVFSKEKLFDSLVKLLHQGNSSALNLPFPQKIF
jgi:hypothetical protein